MSGISVENGFEQRPLDWGAPVVKCAEYYYSYFFNRYYFSTFQVRECIASIPLKYSSGMFALSSLANKLL
ncbi:unnamed protein product [Mycena citricolor]|uniref:Uncharacterized protein n=1 Tax=Mycena citricolor TaxID=2018698 RepID=A0AAD2HLB3_9AGAR|nr:unnamed protein product [Mycena citricolor]